MTITAKRATRPVNLEGRPWYRVEAKADTPSRAVVHIYDAIGGYWGGVNAAAFVKEIAALDVDEIELHINSPGGSVYDGIAIRNALVQHRAIVTSIVDGLAASAASYIALAGEEVVMAPNSELMIHDASGICMGWAQDMTKMAADLDRISNNIASMYADRAGETPQVWRERMLAETWYSADEAVAAGLADRVDGDTDDEPAEGPENRWDLREVFAYAGRSHAPAPPTPNHPTASAAGSTPPVAVAPGDTTQKGSAVDISPEQLTALRQTAGVADDADVDTALAAINEALTERAEPETPAALPPNTIVVDRSAFDELRAQAAQGVAAREEQLAAQRVSALDDAVATGRITPASRPSWAALIERDPAAVEDLQALPAGAIPVTELGHAGALDNPAAAEGETLLADLFPKGA